MQNPWVTKVPIKTLLPYLRYFTLIYFFFFSQKNFLFHRLLSLLTHFSLLSSNSINNATYPINTYIHKQWHLIIQETPVLLWFSVISAVLSPWVSLVAPFGTVSRASATRPTVSAAPAPSAPSRSGRRQSVATLVSGVVFSQRSTVPSRPSAAPRTLSTPSLPVSSPVACWPWEVAGSRPETVPSPVHAFWRCLRVSVLPCRDGWRSRPSPLRPRRRMPPSAPKSCPFI